MLPLPCRSMLCFLTPRDTINNMTHPLLSAAGKHSGPQTRWETIGPQVKDQLHIFREDKQLPLCHRLLLVLTQKWFLIQNFTTLVKPFHSGGQSQTTTLTI